MKPIYCNCSAYLGEHEGFNVIRCKNCGIDYVVNPKEFTNILKNEEISISVTSSEEFDIVVLFLEKLTEEPHCDEEICGCDFYIDESQEMCLSIKNNIWVYATREEEEEHHVKVISYSSVKDLIEKELDR